MDRPILLNILNSYMTIERWIIVAVLIVVIWRNRWRIITGIRDFKTVQLNPHTMIILMLLTLILNILCVVFMFHLVNTLKSVVEANKTSFQKTSYVFPEPGCEAIFVSIPPPSKPIPAKRLNRHKPKKVKIPSVEKVKTRISDHQYYNAKYKDEAEYIKRYWKVAVAEKDKFNIPASIKLAQGLLESNAGASSLARNNNNHFGLKYYRLSKVPRNVRNLLTKNRPYTHRHDDCCTDKKCDEPDKFCSFQTSWVSWRAHSYLLQKNRYKDLYKYGTDYKKWAHGLKKAGYATDKNYAYKLIEIIERHGLYQYDTI